MTRDAQDALARAGLSRRAFLGGCGAIIVGFTVAEGPGGRGKVSAQGRAAASTELDAWLAVGTDGTVTAYTGKCELGQGLLTAQTQLIAEELAVPVSRVRLIQCDTARTPDQGTTSGSQSHPTNFNQANLALAAATARGALLRLAAERLRTPVDRLTMRAGVLRSATGGAEATYGELIGGRRFDLPLDPTARRRSPDAWTVLGTSVPRLDLPALVTGQEEFVQTLRLPGMVHGCVVRPPSVGAGPVRVDRASVQDLPELVDVVVRDRFVGVVAEKSWDARRAAAQLQVTWTTGDGLPRHETLYADLRAARPTRDTRVVDSGDVETRLAEASIVLSASYHYPYQLHGSVGTSCAVADVREDGATLWSASQSVHALRSSAAALLELPLDRVRVIFTRGSGCYGLNGADTVSFDAAILSQAVGRPVRVQLSRRDEMAWENFGSAAVIDQRAAVGGDGTITAWDHESWAPSRGGRPGSQRPGNVVTGFLLGYEPSLPEARSPAPPPTRFSNRANAAPSYVAGCVDGRCGGTGTVASERVVSHGVRSPFWTGPLRSPSRLPHTFAHECFMDELAARVGADPVAYRLRHLRDERLREVVRVTADAAGWNARPSPNPVGTRVGVVTGRGMACVLYEGGNGYCAMVAEVEVDPDTGAVRATRLVIGHDCGPVSNPDGVRNQIEGGALQGLSRALTEEVVWDDRRVTSVDWSTYRSLSLGATVPSIEIVLVDRPDAPASGAGETAITVVAAAVGNAIYDATGTRIRQVPFEPARVREALA